MNFKEYISELIPLAGGEDNILSATHCISRLRLILKDQSLPDEDRIKKLSKTVAISKSANQFQIVIGNQVMDAYKELLSQVERLKGGSPSDAGQQKNADTTKRKLNFIGLFTETVSGIFVPTLVGFLGCGLITGIQAMLVSVNLIQTGDAAYTLFSVLGDTGFFFLPFLLAVSSAERFGCNKYLSIALVGALMHPTFTALLSAGTSELVLGGFFKITLMSYSSTVLPAIFTVYLQSRAEKILEKIIPRTFRLIATPLLVLVVVAPLTLMLIGPIANTLSGWFAGGFSWLYARAAIPGSMILQALYLFLVLTGLHMGLFPISLEMLNTTGRIYLLPLVGGANTALAGCALAIYFRSKDTDMKTTALSAAFVTGVGITEPALYGVVMRSKRLILITIISGAIGGLINGIFQTYANGIGFSPLGSILLQFNPSLPYWVLSTLTTAAVAFVLTFIIGHKDPGFSSVAK
jgi:PTS system beta-glucosides-specific IIC component